MSEPLPCRAGCGACCIAPSISSPTPAHPHGKPAGVRCGHLDAELRCELFGQPQRPAVCASLAPSSWMCGADRDQALARLAWLERATAVRSEGLPITNSRVAATRAARRAPQ